MKEARAKRILLVLGICFMLLFCLAPFVWMILVSFGRNPDFLSDGVEFAATLRNYADILTIKSLHFLEYLRNSLAVSGLVAVACAMIAALGAYAVSRIEFRGRMLLSLAVLAFSMFPQISLIGYLYKFMRSAGVINTYLALVFPYIAWTIPLAFWIMLSYMLRIPKAFDDAARADGAGRFMIFRKIIVPVAAPGIFSAILLVFIAAFNEFLFALMLTTDQSARTIPVGIALFEGLHGEIPWGYIMAASTVASIPLVLLAVAFQRYVIQDVTRGAIKG
ncbi:MAG: carbohydrate ABC transporter permease [bacterium]|jgi:multiple sugar transport system permease protein